MSTRPPSVADLLPALGVRIRVGDLELRGLVDDDLVALCALAQQGIHPPEEMPFAVPWTDAPPAELALNTARYHWRARAELGPEAWGLHLGVWRGGVLVGSQSLEAHDFLATRTAETGSWLGRAHQGQGTGTLMRRAVCAFAFDELGARAVTSGAFVDNPASRAVSRKVGYVERGVRKVERRPGEIADNVSLVLTPDRFVRGDLPIEIAGAAAFRRSIGLPSTPPPSG